VTDWPEHLGNEANKAMIAAAPEIIVALLAELDAPTS